MTVRNVAGAATGRRRRARFAAAALIAAALLAGHAAAAQQQPPGAPQAQPAPPAQARPASSGIFETIGRWFDQSTSQFRDHLRGARGRVEDLGDQAASAGRTIGDGAARAGRGAADATKGAVDVTRNAVDAVVTLPAARVVRGRQVCAKAPNGAPDCQAAADTLCKSAGFRTGTSIDSTSAEKCPARAWLGGRQSGEGECTTEHFISRAMCQ